jgi:dGTPase
MHDIGNPPFGHFGEASIQDWFKKRQEQYREKLSGSPGTNFDELYKDFSMFDGNPQGFRLATRLQWVNDEFGYNLTYTQLAATLKYPWTPEKIGSTKDRVTIKKAGVFYSEAKILAELQTNLEISPFARHPLAYIMEAADDISYCLSDIEDALEKEIVRDMDVIQALRKGLEGLTNNRYAKRILESLPNDEVEDSSWYVKFRTTTTNVLVERGCTLYMTEKNHNAIMEGQYFSLLRKSKTAKALLEVIEEFSKKYLYCSSVVRERELVGYQVTQGILDRFGLLLDLPSKEAEALLIEKKSPNSLGMTLASTLQSFLPRKHIKVYKHTVAEIRELKGLEQGKLDMLEWMARAHLIVDFLSGMTDDFAIVTYRRLYDGGSGRL